MTQANEEQLKAYASLAANSVQENNRVVLFGDKDMSLQLVSNWLKANLFEKMDFSPAILKEAPANEPGFQRGHPTYYHGGGPKRRYAAPSSSFRGHGERL